MTAIPSPAEFLTAAYPDDEHDEPLTLDELVADLERRVTALEGGKPAAEPTGIAAGLALHGHPVPERITVDGQQVHPVVESENEAPEPSNAEYELADLEAKHGVVLELVEEIHAIVKPSTSKVSLQVKAAIERWADPLGTQTPSPAPDATPGASEPAVDDAAAEGPTDVQQRAGEGSAIVPPAVPCSRCLRYFADLALLEQHECAVAQIRPEHDASLEEWRSYARTQQGVPEGTVIDTMNRSQIRTMLGIEQPAGA